MDYPLLSVIISLCILAFAWIMHKYLIDLIEDDKPFMRLVAAFLVVYVAATLVISWLNPTQDAIARVAAQENESIKMSND